MQNPVDIIINLLVVVATVLGSWMAFPQALRLARTRRVEGVSAVWIGVSLAINGWWLTYGLVAGVWAVVPVSIVSLLLYGTMAVVYLATVGRSAIAPMTSRGRPSTAFSGWRFPWRPLRPIIMTWARMSTGRPRAISPACLPGPCWGAVYTGRHV